jgi:hypothetical protein
MVAEEAGGVERVRWGLREFWDEKQNDTGRLLFISSNLSKAVRKREPLLIVLEHISSDSGFNSLLMKL